MNEGSIRPFPRIITDHLVLRRFEERDLKQLLAYRNDPQVERWQGWGTYDEDRGHELIAALTKAEFGVPGEDKSSQVAFELRSSRELVGDAMLQLRAEDPSIAKIGYTIAPEFQRRGLAREGVKALLQYAVPSLSLRSVEAFAVEDNVASISLLESLGFEETSRIAADERRFVLHIVAPG